MAHQLSQASVDGNTHLPQQQRKLQNGGPKNPHKSYKKSKSNITKVVNDTRTGDAVSDESDDAGNDGDSSADEDDDDNDEPDVPALSGARCFSNSATPRLTGFSRKLSDASHEEFAVGGAEADLNNESDDAVYDRYEDVVDISDGDSIADVDESRILRSAEQDLIAEFERSERPSTANGVTNDMVEMTIIEEPTLASQVGSSRNESQDSLSEFDWHADPYLGLKSQDHAYQALSWGAQADYWDGEMSRWRTTEREGSAPSATQKKVRFEETASSRASSVSSEEDPRDSFPDLFDDQDIMAVQHHVLYSDGVIDAATDNESVFEYDFDDEQLKVEACEENESDSESEMSDSESDMGDTTDEDTPEEQLARVQKLKASNKGLVPALGPLSVVPRTPAASKRNSPNLSRSNSNAASSQLTTPKASGQPKSGTFAHDPTRASVTAGARGNGIKLVCPSKPPAENREYWNRARQAMGSRDGSPGGSVSWTRATPRTASIPQRPFTAKSTLGTMFDGNLDFLHSNDEHGIAKDLFRSSRKNSIQSSFTSNSMTDADGTDESSNVNMADYVQMDDSDSDMDELQAENLTSPPSHQHIFNESMLESSPMRDGATGLLDHFDQQRGLVSSFRNNQHIARHVSSLPANPARRAQMSEANALQQGRRAAANTPMTPARKKRQDLDSTSAGVKKTGSPLVQKHRRSRGSSLSGVQANLALDRFSEQTQ